MYSFATETQIQEYLIGKYEDFLKKTEEMHWPIKIACKAFGLRCVSDEEAESVDYETSEKVWVLNRDMHVSEDGELYNPKESPFIWLGAVRKTKGNSENVASHELKSTATCSGQDPTRASLKVLLRAVINSYLNNLPSALLALGAQVLNVHYE